MKSDLGESELFSFKQLSPKERSEKNIASLYLLCQQS